MDEEQDELQRVGASRRFWIAVAVWWLLLCLQVWFGWELNEAYASCLPLLMIGPETPFALAGLALGGFGFVAGIRRRAWSSTIARAITLGTALLVLVASPVMKWSAEVHLWRNENEYLAQVEAFRTRGPAAPPPDSPTGSLPWSPPVHTTASGELFEVEGDPPRFAFARRWIGAFHWAALVHDAARTVEADVGRDRRAFVFGYSLLGYVHLRGDWYVVSAMK